MINSQKGKAYFEKVKQRINYIQVPFKSIEAGNRSLNLSVDPPKVDRKQFFEDLDKMSFVQIADKYIKNPISLKRRIKNLLKKAYTCVKATQYSPKALFKLLCINSISDIIQNKVILPTPYCCIQIEKGANIIKKVIFY